MAILPECKDGFERLQKHYRQRGLVLFLGSGLSAGCGLPTWRDFTERVFDSIPKGKVFLDLLEDGRYSEPAKLSWAKTALKDAFLPTLRAALYRDLRFPNGSTPEEIRAEMRAMNSTLSAVGEFLCIESGSGWLPNPNVPAILTTNVDTLLTSYVRKAYPSSDGLLRSVERASAGPRGRRIPVYYLHGMFNSGPGAGLDKEAPDRAIFTEADYFLAYRDSLSVFSYVPSFLFREYAVLFLGTRLDDPNVRRLLCWSQSEIEKGYQSEGQELPQRKQIRHYALMPSTSESEQGIAAALLQPLGVAPLWFENYGDLLSILRELRRENVGRHVEVPRGGT